MNEERLEEVMRLYTQDLLRISYYYTKSLQTAQDVVQEVFIRYYQMQLELKDEELKYYLIRMVRNKSKDYLKSWHYRKTKLVDKFFSKTTGNSDLLIKQEEEQEISKAIFSLPINQREAITYYYFEGYTTKGLAELLQVPEGTIKSRLQKGRSLLKEQLKSVEWEALLHD